MTNDQVKLQRFARRLVRHSFFSASWLIPYCVVSIPMIFVVRGTLGGFVVLALAPIIGIPWMLFWLKKSDQNGS